ncbi:universal stress protein [Streptomyces sp. NBC_01381]|uniref:universal stress protein n=1 Tax=Streptomyces sp. NBC_01381 TaxID=2903845 RepID=UPI0022537ACE|nr:universal stress protein [Streptomyces sp. NBC_01381]MCX4672998.1 universal stress protein [Streptomyces sp. NBC_01381]
MTELAAGNSIVVGVDGSEASMAALRWATRQAHALDADVVAVHAWEPAGPRLAPYAPTSAFPTAAEQRDRAAQLLASTLREVFGPRIDHVVRAILVEGPPARVLVQQARGALLLALGRTAHGQYGQPAIGAVGRACLRNAAIPVVAVPATDRSATPLGVVTAPLGARGGATQRAEGAEGGSGEWAVRPSDRPARPLSPYRAEADAVPQRVRARRDHSASTTREDARRSRGTSR